MNYHCILYSAKTITNTSLQGINCLCVLFGSISPEEKLEKTSKWKYCFIMHATQTPIFGQEVQRHTGRVFKLAMCCFTLLCMTFVGTVCCRIQKKTLLAAGIKSTTSPQIGCQCKIKYAAHNCMFILARITCLMSGSIS